MTKKFHASQRKEKGKKKAKPAKRNQEPKRNLEKEIKKEEVKVKHEEENKKNASDCYLRGQLFTKHELNDLHDLLESPNINLDHLVSSLEYLFKTIFDPSNPKITMREKTGIIEESIKVFYKKKEKKYILLRIKVLELLSKIKENIFIPLSFEITKIIEEIIKHIPSEEGGVVTGYKLKDEKWNEEISQQMFKKILRIAYKYLSKHSGNLGFLDLVPFISKKLSSFENEDSKNLLKVINEHADYLEKNKGSKTFLTIEERKEKN